jgi:hypothetical protein
MPGTSMNTQRSASSTVGRQVFQRPIEIVTGKNDVLGFNDGSARTITIDPGVYSCHAAVMYAFQIASADNATTMHPQYVIGRDSNSDGFIEFDELIIKLEFSASISSIDFTQGSAGVEEIFGAQYYSGSGTTWYGDDQPDYIWLSSFQETGPNRFQRRIREDFGGLMSSTGFVAGNNLGDAIYYKTMRYENERAENVVLEAQTEASNFQWEYNLQSFVHQCKTVVPTVSTNPSPRGFYYFPDWNSMDDFIAVYSAGTSGVGGTGGIKFDAVSPDKYAFCQFDPDEIKPSGFSYSHNRNYMDVTFGIHTQTEAPTWTAASPA